jgi:hypothetical protein
MPKMHSVCAHTSKQQQQQQQQPARVSSFTSLHESQHFFPSLGGGGAPTSLTVPAAGDAGVVPSLAPGLAGVVTLLEDGEAADDEDEDGADPTATCASLDPDRRVSNFLVPPSFNSCFLRTRYASEVQSRAHVEDTEGVVVTNDTLLMSQGDDTDTHLERRSKTPWRHRRPFWQTFP